MRKFMEVELPNDQRMSLDVDMIQAIMGISDAERNTIEGVPEEVRLNTNSALQVQGFGNPLFVATHYDVLRDRLNRALKPTSAR